MDSLLFLEQALSLLLMPRSHVRSLGNNTFDTIASHSFMVAVLAYIIARDEGFDQETASKAMMMGLFHDFEEARTGDHDFIAKHYTEVKQMEAINDQFSRLPYGDELKDLILEYEERESDASKCAKDADHVCQMMMEWNLMWMGNDLAKEWFESDLENRIPQMETESAKKIAKELPDSSPNDWKRSKYLKGDRSDDVKTHK